MSFHIIIPARFQASRLPGKLLMEVQGMTVLQRVYRQCQQALPLSITIATDHECIYEHALAFGCAVEMTSPHHENGTSRIAEVIEKKGFAKDAHIVNVQGDEPLIPPALIRQVASLLEDGVPMATLYYPIHDPLQINNPNVVKVVRDNQGFALYFSRSPIPHGGNLAYKHIGLYAYQAQCILEYVNLPPSPLETVERLEQLRALQAGFRIKVAEALVMPEQEINTPDDLAQLRARLAKPTVA